RGIGHRMRLRTLGKAGILLARFAPRGLPPRARNGTIAARLAYPTSSNAPMARKRPARPSGTTVILEHTSKVLADNPLGDPHVRRLGVWLPPGYDEGTARGRSSGRGKRYPVLFDLVGFTGSGLAHLNWRPFDENVP